MLLELVNIAKLEIEYFFVLKSNFGISFSDFVHVPFQKVTLYKSSLKNYQGLIDKSHFLFLAKHKA